MQALFLRITICFVVMLNTIGCAKAPEGWSAFARPRFMRMHHDQNYGADNDWTKGFNDGCVTATEGSGGLHSMLSPRIDGWKLTGRNPKNPKEPHPEIKSAKIYGKGWFDGYEHCTYQYDWWAL
jgi:hypothetical protein